MALRKCPYCRLHLLTPVQHEQVELDACTRCGGLWFDRDELDRVIAAHEPDFADDEPLVQNLGMQLGEAQKSCPVCQVPLVTYKLAQESDLQIDVCHECHGIWLDQGELDHARAFAEVPGAMERIHQETTWGTWFFEFFLHLPVEFNIKPRTFPTVTVALIIINTLLMAGLYLRELSPFLRQWAFMPAAPKTAFWFATLVTHQFLHGNWMHLIGNMYFLYILGDNVEDALGHLHYVVFYLLCGVLGGLAHAMFTMYPEYPMLGASGAVSGIIGAYIVIFRRARMTFMIIFWQRKLRAVWYFAIWVAFNILGVISGALGVAWFAHLGGFVAGVASAYLFYNSVITRKPLIRYINASSKR